jgi:hypothetical protein
MVISDLNFLAEITTGELAITKGGQTAPIATPGSSVINRRSATLTLNVRNFVNTNALASISNCDAIYEPDQDNPGVGFVTFECDAQERQLA